MTLVSPVNGEAGIVPTGFLRACTDRLSRLVVSKAGHPSFLLVERDGRFESYRRRRDGQLALIESWDHEDVPGGRTARLLRRHAFDLRLDAANTVTTSICLPAAGRKHIASIIRHQIERLTPWAPEKAVYGHVILENGPSGDPSELTVRLTVMSRAVFARRMAPLIKAGLSPALVGVSDDPLDRPSALDMRPDAGAPQRARRGSRALVAVAIAIGATAAFASLAWSNHDRHAQSMAMTQEIDRLRGTVSTIEGTAAESKAGEPVMVLDRKRRSWPMVLVLEDLSVVLPDSTYLTDLSVDGGTLRMSGLSSAPSELIAILDGSRMLADVHFSAPVTRNRDGDRDSFEIEAVIVERSVR